ncbi:DUF6173 family protein [Psychromarinibacter sp. C21-152]|uniref:DUF6173 family protein n=1 Tax=Psychromarinibacter sediminicola TaxID=3033385 RepID=A0AAE3T854_9RHOB|nr:DUF6173 family protein [Psychromarinibacter sediminicola]MDF0601040.1 DUF6173 family protein [Psychromarinibacter sediminicola]
MEHEIHTAAEAGENHAMPRAHAVHADPEAEARSAALEVPEGVARKPLAAKSAAQWAYERLVLYIRNFEQQLDNEHEVAMGFTGADAGVIRIEGVGYFDPDIVTFYGSDPAGGKNQLIQHVSQLNVLLRAVPKPRAEDAPRRIGFRLTADLEKGGEGG